VVHVDVECELYEKIRKLVKEDLRYTSIRHFVNLAIKEKMNGERREK